MKVIIFLLLIPFPLFAQADPHFTTTQIDSIVNKLENTPFSDSGYLEEKNGELVIGKGAFNNSVFCFPEQTDATIPCKIIKGIYDETIYYSDLGVTRDFTGEFYYYENELFLVRLTETTRERNKKPAIITAEIDPDKEVDKQIPEQFNLDIKNWIFLMNENFLKY